MVRHDDGKRKRPRRKPRRIDAVRRREVVVMTRLTAEERERLERCAARDFRTVSGWLRKAMMQAIEQAERDE